MQDICEERASMHVCANLGLNAPLLHLVDNRLHNSEKYVVLKKDTKISNTSKTIDSKTPNTNICAILHLTASTLTSLQGQSNRNCAFQEFDIDVFTIIIIIIMICPNDEKQASAPSLSTSASSQQAQLGLGARCDNVFFQAKKIV